MDTKFDELLEFPCSFPFKVVGLADPQLPDHVVKVVQAHVPGDYRPTTAKSSKGTYHSITIRVKVESKQQVESLYSELATIPGVRRVL
ncbi:DUF493 family protein YbeD [Paraferrimonas sedimenticola]|uniref:UPF0250 protein GCM10007895_33270 n=1 Tax=Paraferrimonas sedimenticola TaxID=375674 RepID=A0AA37W2F4_9GAMM|nr:DUF493 family protein YbeD [Paraferrimonas sedimenticola]GLP98020.1 UPF0250 protein [Paraferrimonas sedimenticola]